jgi:hypothetical protein
MKQQKWMMMQCVCVLRSFASFFILFFCSPSPWSSLLLCSCYPGSFVSFQDPPGGKKTKAETNT